MLTELLWIMKWMPKITVVYAVFSFLNGMAISNIALGVALAFDMLDYIPID